MVRIHQGALVETSGDPFLNTPPEASITGRWQRRDPMAWQRRPANRCRVAYLQLSASAEPDALTPHQPNQPQPCQRPEDPVRHFQQSIRRWGNSLAVRIPAYCLRQAGLREGDPIEIVVGPDGRLSLEPLQRLDRTALAADLRQLQATMPLTPSVIEACRGQERW